MTTVRVPRAFIVACALIRETMLLPLRETNIREKMCEREKEKSSEELDKHIKKCVARCKWECEFDSRACPSRMRRRIEIVQGFCTLPLLPPFPILFYPTLLYSTLLFSFSLDHSIYLSLFVSSSLLCRHRFLLSFDFFLSLCSLYPHVICRWRKGLELLEVKKMNSFIDETSFSSKLLGIIFEQIWENCEKHLSLYFIPLTNVN